MTEEDKEKAPPLPPKTDEASQAEEEFVRGLVERGEAAKTDEHGKLPPGATHEIVGTTASGMPIVVRRRFASKRF
jgi:hypothetical protein